MLVPAAIIGRDAVHAAIRAGGSEIGKRMLWYRQTTAAEWLPSIEENDWSQIQRLSLDDDDQIVGMMSAFVCRETNTITNLTAISFQPVLADITTYAQDLKEFVLALAKEFDIVRYSVILENPARRSFIMLAEKLGGKQVGRFSRYARLADGSIHDVEYYEIPGTGAAGLADGSTRFEIPDRRKPP